MTPPRISEDIPAALEELLDRIPELVRSALPDGWPELVDIIENAMPSPQPRLMVLPIACASAGRGDVPASVHAAAAWSALNLSLRILDDLQDRDREDGLWQSIGPSRAYHYAATLREVASCIIANARDIDADIRVAAIADMTRTLLLVGRGQEADLQGGGRDVRDGWTIMQDKSGELFALACRLGCQLAGVEPAITAALSRYGFHLGMLLQLLDDLASVLPAEQYRDLRFGRMGFPLRAAFALQGDSDELDRLTSAPLPWDAPRIAELIETMGARGFTVWTARQEQQRALYELDGLGIQGRRILEHLCTAPFPESDVTAGGESVPA